ncbi:MAG TPA: beta-ketoacyl-ACP synthase II [Verrucomicrobiales bacterium]|nr:beta-ketoacyl-ACP synthase II [Verrucomicrobiales bacterium]
MSNRRVVVTGLGVMSPIGNDLETFWNNLVAGKSGIRPITQFDVSAYPCRIAGHVPDFDPAPFFNNPKEVRRNDRFTVLACGAAKMAVRDSGVDFSKLDPARSGVMIGTGIGGIQTLEAQEAVLLARGPAKVSPFIIPMMIGNIASGIVSMEYGIQGPNFCIVTACASSNHNLGEAWRTIRAGDADLIIAGGAEASVAPISLAGFSSMRALSTRNDEPEKASRPFDRDRDGFVMGEGAGILVLEELEQALRRGARIYCEFAGYGLSADAYHLTSPHPDGNGACACMEMALRHAKLDPSAIGYVNAHGTSTPLGDRCETNAIKRTFGTYARNGLLVSSTKSMTGHLLGAAGGVEAAASILALTNSLIPPTINLDHPDPECDLDYVANTAREARVDSFLSNSFGFGGHNASIICRRFEG